MSAPPAPRIVAWELTRACNLRCRHCRATAGAGAREAGELTRDESLALVEDFAAIGVSLLILTGGEPLLAPGLWAIAARARAKGLKVALGTNGTLVDEGMAARIAEAGFVRVSVSIDFPSAAEHDRFRGVAGAFEAALRGIAALRRAGVGVQINSTVTKRNRVLLPALHDLAVRVGAEAFHPFLLVPTGRGADLAGEEISAAEYEETLGWLCERAKTSPLQIKPTDAPQYQRVLCGRSACGAARGCLAGTGFCFVGHTGDVQPCGYFDCVLGNVRERPFAEIWRTSPVLDDLRHPERLKGKCGACDYRAVCGGCRARALAQTGDFLADDPLCAYVPERVVMARLLAGFPIAERPYAELGRELGLTEEACHARVGELVANGRIRRIGAFFDWKRIGYATTLAALAVPPERLDEVAAQVNALPGVTHNYAREGRYNLWFTLVAPTRAELTEALTNLCRRTGIDDFLDLPALKTYKLRMLGTPQGPVRSGGFVKPPRDLVRRLQANLVDFGLTPFGGPHEVEAVRALVESGAIRRFGAVASPAALGFTANALTAWCVPAEDLDAVGGRFAASSAVSHCYARAPQEGWPYNLYAMVHARSQEELSALIAALEPRTTSHAVLRTVRDYRRAATQASIMARAMDPFAGISGR